jgi:exonuclease VII large subunit
MPSPVGGEYRRTYEVAQPIETKRSTGVGATLNAVSPLSTLARGYAIVTTVATGQVVRDAAVLAVTARFARGEVDCEVLRTRGGLTGAEVAP